MKWKFWSRNIEEEVKDVVWFMNRCKRSLGKDTIPSGKSWEQEDKQTEQRMMDILDDHQEVLITIWEKIQKELEQENLQKQERQEKEQELHLNQEQMEEYLAEEEIDSNQFNKDMEAMERDDPFDLDF